MSAFVISNKHISAMLAATEHYKHHYHYTVRYEFDGRLYDFKDMRRVGQILLDQNHKSVNIRYDENTTGFFSYVPTPKMPLVHVLSLCMGYEYQACEDPDWHKSEAYAIVQKIKDQCIQFLPGMDDAPWTI